MNRYVLIGVLALGCWSMTSEAFLAPQPRSVSSPPASTTALGMGMSRKARRQMQSETRSKVGRDKKFRDAVADEDEKKDRTEPTPPDNAAGEEMQRRMEQRPDVSNLYVDEETGMEIIQQGRYVMDVITRKAVQLNSNPQIRMAQMFPGIPMEVRDEHRFDWATCEVPGMIDALRDACSVKQADGSMELPKAPSVTNKGIDFVLANRDLLGHRMSKTMGKLMMRAAWLEEKDQMRSYRNLMQNFLTIENYISAPFRQIIMDVELAIGPNFGNLDLEKFIGKELNERAAAYIVLKGMQCTWEKKLRDSEVIENTPQTESNYYSLLATGDPRRYHPEPEVIWEKKECARVCAMAIEMVKTFVGSPTMFDDLPVELRFIEVALTIQGGATLRKYIEEDFCPKEEITPEALREGMRRLLQQLDSMYLDPYADIRNVVDKLQRAMAIGTEDARSPFDPYLNSLSSDSPGYFQTYTFNHSPMSLVRFMDTKKFEPAKQYEDPKGEAENPFTAFFQDFGGNSKPKNKVQPSPFDDAGEYVVPKDRSLGRPHNMSWLQSLDEMEEEEDGVFGQVAPGEIIFEK